MEPVSLAIFAAALFMAALSPGPAVAAIVARVLARGTSGTAAFVLGVGLGDLVWLSLAVGGLAVLAQTFHWLFVVVKWAGVAYLLHISWRMWRAPGRVAGQAASPEERSVPLTLAGLALTMGNPKVMVFYLALLPTLVDLTTLTWLGFAELLAVTAAVLAAVFTFYVALAARARAMLVSPGRVRAVNRASALAMAGAAGWVASR